MTEPNPKKPEKLILDNCVAVKPPVPTMILQLLPPPNSLPQPVHPVIVNVVPAHVTPLLFAIFKVCTPVPNAIVPVVFRLIVPIVSEKPAGEPVLNVPATKIICELLGMALFAPNLTVDVVLIVVDPE